MSGTPTSPKLQNARLANCLTRLLSLAETPLAGIIEKEKRGDEVILEDICEYLCFQLNFHAHEFLLSENSNSPSDRVSLMIAAYTVLRTLVRLLEVPTDENEIADLETIDTMLPKFEQVYGNTEDEEFHAIFEMLQVELQFHACFGYLPIPPIEETSEDISVTKEQWDTFKDCVNMWFPKKLTEADISPDDVVAIVRAKAAADIQETVVKGYDPKRGTVPFDDLEYLMFEHPKVELAYVLRKFGQIFHLIEFGVPSMMTSAAPISEDQSIVAERVEPNPHPVAQLADVADVYKKLGGKRRFESVRQGIFHTESRNPTRKTSTKKSSASGTAQAAGSTSPTKDGSPAAKKRKRPIVLVPRNDVFRKGSSHTGAKTKKTRIPGEVKTRSVRRDQLSESDSEVTVSDNNNDTPTSHVQTELLQKSQKLATQISRYGDPLDQIMAEDREILNRSTGESQRTQQSKDSEGASPSWIAKPAARLKSKRLNVKKPRRTKVDFSSQFSDYSSNDDQDDEAQIAQPSRRRKVRLQPVVENEISPLKEAIELPKKTRSKQRSSMTSKPRRHRFTEEEEEWVLEGVEKFGVGHWRAILDEYPFHKSRTTVAIKDKYRNIIKKRERESNN